jgi:uncharacterized protein YktB (UPF0637 family)
VVGETVLAGDLSTLNLQITVCYKNHKSKNIVSKNFTRCNVKICNNVDASIANCKNHVKFHERGEAPLTSKRIREVKMMKDNLQKAETQKVYKVRRREDKPRIKKLKKFDQLIRQFGCDHVYYSF